MLAVAGMCPVPADVDVRVAVGQQLKMLSRAPEGVLPPAGRLIVRSPEDETDVDPAARRAFEDVQRGAATARHLERRPHECHCCPYAFPGELDSLADAAKGGLAIDQRQDP